MGKLGEKLRVCIGRGRLRGKIFAAFACFVAILLVLLWLFQIVFLNSFYENIQTRAIRNVAAVIAKNIDSAAMPEALERLYAESRISARIVNQYGNDLYAVGTKSAESTIGKLLPIQLMLIFADAEQQGGSTLQIFGEESEESLLYQPLFELHSGSRRNIQSIIYGKLVTAQSGEKVLVLLNSTITPITSTVYTLQVQLVIISVIMLVLSALIAFFLARMIAKPIVRINDSAKVLATGDYNARFEGGGYREVAELADTLNYAAGELGKVETMRRDFIANVSHDLRTPLTMITGYGEVMRDLPGENTPENVQTIIDEADRLTTLVNDLLDLSRLQSGQQTIEMARLDLTGMVEAILQRYARLISHEGYTVRFEHGETAFVTGDATRLTQVVYNLINNAITYTGSDKTVTVRQSVVQGWVRIDVIDTGEGIAEADLPYIWDRYYKGDKTHKRAAIGTGLGLSIVRGVLELHGARYGVQSEPGCGSDFWFELPVAE